MVEENSVRLDAYLAAHVSDISRARVRQLIDAGEVRVNGEAVKASHKVKIGDVIDLCVPEPEAPVGVEAENIPLEIVYQDADLVVINKPAGLVVHPAAGNWTGTLVNALLYHVKDLSGIGGELRPGIVHRLDKETSGLMLAAKNDIAHRKLSEMIQERTVSREYMALAWGVIEKDDFTVDAPIGRHPVDRQRMAVLEGENVRHTRRHAVTHFTVSERMINSSALTAKLETGRTHQIRVHLYHVGHPVVGDPIYGEKLARRFLAQLTPENRTIIEALPGQALHAFRLSFPHPITSEPLSFEAAPPEHYVRAWEALRGKMV